MTQSEMKALYRKKINPRVLFGTINAFVAFLLAFYFLVGGISRCSAGKMEGSGKLIINDFPLNDKEAPQQAGEDKAEQERLWSENFTRLAQPLKVTDTQGLYEFRFRIKDFPLSNNLWGEVAIEVYNQDKEYLFTFYADDYWNQDGYDEGEYWHEWNLVDKVTAQFPVAGTYYLVAGVPLTAQNQLNTPLINLLQKYTESTLFFSYYSGVKTVNMFAVIMAFIIFTVIGFILVGIRSSQFSKGHAVLGYFNFQKNHYLVKLPENIAQGFFEVTGYSRRQGQSNTSELILSQDGKNAFLEIEREVDDDKTYFYTYFYQDFPEDDFEGIPREKNIQYRNLNFSRESSEGTLNIFYYNGLKESRKKHFIDYGTADEKNYLSFEYETEPAEFDVSLGRLVKGVRIWEVAK